MNAYQGGTFIRSGAVPAAFTLLRVVTAAGFLGLLIPTGALAQVFDLLAGDSSAIYHYPGADGRIGTNDDVVSSKVTGIVGSDPNVHGAFSYAVFEAFVADPLLPGDNTAVSFVHGMVEIDPAVAAAGGGPLILDGSVIGTGFGQGLGTSTLEILAVNGGTFDPVTGAMTLNADIEASAAGVTRQFTGGMITGSAVVLATTDFGAGSGDAFVDNVLIPKAQALNAQGLIFMEFSGVAPLDPPWVIIPAPFTVVLAGLTGIPSAENADIEIGKMVPAGPFTADDQLTFTLTATNLGPAAATGMVVSDPLPNGLNWVSDTCGAGPPTAGLLTWNADTLNAAQSIQCDVLVEVSAQANFDRENGATAFAEPFDPDLDNNVAVATVSAVQPAAAEGLAQAPDFVTGFPSDIDCDNCPLGAQAMAENFKVENQLQLQQIVFFGGYTDNQPFSDQLHIEIRENLERSRMPGVPGVPGALIADLSGPVTRTATGNLIAGFFNEYQYTADAALTLPRGIYWIVVYNDSGTGGSGGDWFWESGGADAGNRGLATITANNAIPPHPRWSPNPDFQLALSIGAGAAGPPEQPVGVPALGPAGLALLMFLAMLGAWLMMWRRRPE